MSKIKVTKGLLKEVGDMGAWSGIYSKFKEQSGHKEFIDFLKAFYLPPKRNNKPYVVRVYKVTKNKMGKTEIWDGEDKVGVQG